MSEIGAYEAKTNLSRLLNKVRDGEQFVITRHGQPVAELIPYSRLGADAMRRIVSELRETRSALADSGLRLRQLLGEGESLRDLVGRGRRF